jgi:hypothetical protein
MEVALEDNPVLVTRAYFDRDRAYRFARSFGVTRVRVNVNWAFMLSKAQRHRRTKPQFPAYDFTLLNSLIESAAKRGIRVHLSLTGPAPAWATGNRKVGPYKVNAARYAEWAALMAQHYSGRVDRYSIWNEGNWHSWLAPLKKSPYIYRALYQRGYSAIKRADPNAKVFIGETAPFARKGLSIAPLAWLRRVACVNSHWRRTSSRCPRLKADGYAHHPYDFAHSPSFRYPGDDNVTMGTLPRLTKALDRLSRAGALRYTRSGRMPVYLTEYGYFASGRRALPKRQAAKYLAQAFQIALRNGRVKSMLQYLLVTPPKNKSYAYFNTGVITTRGAKLPAFHALRSFYRKNRGRLKRPGGPIAF